MRPKTRKTKEPELEEIGKANLKVNNSPEDGAHEPFA
jgi:hypothetical protein